MKGMSAIQNVNWGTVRAEVAQVNPTLAGLIDKLNPQQDHVLYKAQYPFGACFIDQGTLMLPSKHGKLVPIHHPEIDHQLQNNLGYRSIPFGLWLNACGEVFVNMDSRIIPLHIFNPGSIFGLWEVLDPPHCPFVQRIWSISVGVRSLFMLPKVTDAISHDKLLRAYQLRRLPPPKKLTDQFKIFAEITNSEKANIRWQGKILFFSAKWFEEELDNIHWLKLHYYLLKSAWAQSIYWRNKVTFRLMQQAFATAQETKNLKASPYLIDTLMHLILIGLGSSPGFAPIVDDETCGPIPALQQAYIDNYGLKSYIPTIFCPHYLAQDESAPIYYSLQLPTLLGASPKAKSQTSIVNDLRLLKFLVETLENKLKDDNNSLYKLIKNLRFDFFHTEADLRNGIRPTSQLLKEDPRFNNFSKQQTDRIFCETGPFLRGCVRISRQT